MIYVSGRFSDLLDGNHEGLFGGSSEYSAHCSIGASSHVLTLNLSSDGTTIGLTLTGSKNDWDISTDYDFKFYYEDGAYKIDWSDDGKSIDDETKTWTNDISETSSLVIHNPTNRDFYIGSNGEVAQTSSIEGRIYTRNTSIRINNDIILDTYAYNDINKDITFGIGKCRDYDNTVNIKKTKQITKKIDSTWEQGSFRGGLASGVSLIADTTYPLHELSNDDGTVLDNGFDTSFTASNLLSDTAVISAGLTKYRFIGFILTDSSGNIEQYILTGDYNDQQIWWDDFYGYTDAGTSSTPRLKYIKAPIGIDFSADISVNPSGAGNYSGNIYSPIHKSYKDPSVNYMYKASVSGTAEETSWNGYILTNNAKVYMHETSMVSAQNTLSCYGGKYSR
ncbi:MAG: hypothetical protein ACTSP4_00635 [Candidatus Hodarchaeales archaeon]